MDKYEYKIRADEINRLIAERDYAQAAEIADSIDWRRVKSVMMLCTVSDLYKINRRYEDAKNMLLLAYERRPGGRTICYSLCELCIKTEEFVRAVNFYSEFVQAAPKDPGRYILQYKIYEAQDVSLEERIGVLEELKKRDYREKWAYELAYLYHRVGLATRCVEECDELILWFGEGKYVVKAMELKMLHQPLTPAQQEAYDHRFDRYDRRQSGEQAAPEPEEQEPSGQEDQSGAYSDLPEGQEDFYGGQEGWSDGYGQEAPAAEAGSAGEEELDIQVKTMDVGKFNTINLQEELAAGLQEVLKADEITRSIVAPMLESGGGEEDAVPEPEEDSPQEAGAGDEEVEIFFGETGEIKDAPGDMVREMTSQAPAQNEDAYKEPETAAEEEPARESEETSAENGPENQEDRTGELVMEQMRGEAVGESGEQIAAVQPPRELAGVLSQESDGQIRLVVPEIAAVEKQITGQMKIEDILAEWERMKRENQERCREDVRQHVLQQTGPMFTEFDAAVRDGLLEQLETDDGSQGIEEAAGDAFGGEHVPDDLDEIEELSVLEAQDAAGAGESGEPESDMEYAGFEEQSYKDGENFASDGTEESEDGSDDPSDSGDPQEYPDDYEDEPEELGEPGEEEADPAEYPDDYEDEPEELGESGEEPDPEEYSDDYEDEPEDLSAPGEETDPEEYSDDYEEGPEDPEESGEEPEDSEEYPDDYEEDPEDLRESGEEPDPEELSGEAGESKQGEASGSQRDRSAQKDHKQEGGRGLTKGSDGGRQPIERDKAKIRSLTREEKELYAPFIQSRRSREQLVKAIDNISMAAYTGNIVITGEEGMDTLTLAKNMIREIKMADSNFAGKVAKIAGQDLNGRNVKKTIEEMNSGALIIYKASGMNPDTAKALYRSLQQERLGIVVVLEDTKKAIQKLFAANQELSGAFTARVDMEALSNDMLVLFGKRYAREMEYSIDELGVLALHTRIEELQTIDHVVTVVDVKRIVDEAIRHASRKTLGHFFDILLAKRYDDEDMIVLTEKDFVA